MRTRESKRNQSRLRSQGKAQRAAVQLQDGHGLAKRQANAEDLGRHQLCFLTVEFLVTTGALSTSGEL